MLEVIILIGVDSKSIIDRLRWNSSYFANMKDACKHNQTWSCQINRGRCREHQVHPNRHGFQANHGTGTYCQRNGRRGFENKSYVSQNHVGQHCITMVMLVLLY